MDKRSIYYKYFWQKSVAIVNKWAFSVKVGEDCHLQVSQAFVGLVYPTFSNKNTLSIALATNPKLVYSLKAGILSG
jgi:hypothetical protein